MKVLVVGSGGREHAIVWKLSKSDSVKKIYAAPGNAGIYHHAELVNIRAEDIDGLIKFAKEHTIDLTVVGPELPLALGIVDRFQAEGLKIFGPTRAAAEIESSKTFAKEFMHRHHIPTASFMTFDNLREAQAFVKQSVMPIAIKADGLAAGKGVIIVENVDRALAAIRDMIQKRRFGDAGLRIIIEEVLTGEEASILALTDGKNIIPMVSSQDHKRIGNSDTGPNTGGMGAYAPVPFISERLEKDIYDLILQPTIEGLAEEGREFRGVLYAGLMITERGPKVIEFNCRFGDPETQVVLPLVKSDFGMLLMNVADGDISCECIEWRDAAAVCVVLASGGYPGKYEKGKTIYGLKDVRGDDLIIFHSGTRYQSGHFLTDGGRVLGVTAIDEHIESAIALAYEAVELINFEDKQFRSDIGFKANHKTLDFM